MRNLTLLLINIYKRFFSLLFFTQCRFTPSCSQYVYQAIIKYGTIRGLLLGIKRVGRCHPWTKGGFDPIP